MPRAGHLHTGRALCASIIKCCELLWKPPQTLKTASPTNHLPSPNVPQCRLHHNTCCTLQRLHLTLQYPMACPGLATHTLAGLWGLWLPSASSSSGNLHKPAKLQAPQTTCPALLQPPVHAPPHLLHIVQQTEFDLAVVPHGMPGTGHSHTGRALCAVVAEFCLLVWKSPQTGKTVCLTNQQSGPAAAPCIPHQPWYPLQRLQLTF